MYFITDVDYDEKTISIIDSEDWILDTMSRKSFYDYIKNMEEDEIEFANAELEDLQHHPRCRVVTCIGYDGSWGIRNGGKSDFIDGSVEGSPYGLSSILEIAGCKFIKHMAGKYIIDEENDFAIKIELRGERAIIYIYSCWHFYKVELAYSTYKYDAHGSVIVNGKKLIRDCYTDASYIAYDKDARCVRLGSGTYDFYFDTLGVDIRGYKTHYFRTGVGVLSDIRSFKRMVLMQ